MPWLRLASPGLNSQELILTASQTDAMSCRCLRRWVRCCSQENKINLGVPARKAVQTSSSCSLSVMTVWSSICRANAFSCKPALPWPVKVDMTSIQQDRSCMTGQCLGARLEKKLFRTGRNFHGTPQGTIQLACIEDLLDTSARFTKNALVLRKKAATIPTCTQRKAAQVNRTAENASECIIRSST